MTTLNNAKTIANTIARIVKAYGKRGIGSGEVYARLAPVVSATDYQVILSWLVDGGFIEQSTHHLTWK